MKNNDKTALINKCSSRIDYYVAQGLKKLGFHGVATAHKAYDNDIFKNME